MNAFTQFTVVAGLSLVAAGATWLVKGRPIIPVAIVVVCDKNLIKKDEICLADVPENVLWVDARPRSEWEENGLEGSVLWNMDPSEDDRAFEASVASRIFESGTKTVVVYCGSESCGTSRSIAERITALNLGPSVKVLFGGWDALKGKFAK